MNSPREVFLRLVNGVCNGPYEDLAGLYAEQTHVTHPFHPLNPPPLRSRQELHEHFTASPPVARTLSRKPVDITIHETADPEVVGLERVAVAARRDHVPGHGGLGLGESEGTGRRLFGSQTNTCVHRSGVSSWPDLPAVVIGQMERPGTRVDSPE